MRRAERVEKICRSLARRGWLEVFKPHGLNLTAPNLVAELSRNLKIDRSQPGFSDFCLDGHKGVEPGDPARSLLYHGLASPDVHPIAGRRNIGNDAYPSLEELDAIENYIYSLKPFEQSDLEEAFFGVFAYKYRPAASSAHGYHADLVFSRTGIARVGTAEAAWHGPWRSFRADPPKRNGISVCPARYGAFIAKATSADDHYLIPLIGRRDEQDDPVRTFHYPVHKLFPGSDCISGAEIDLSFQEYHRNEKLRKLHVVGGLQVAPGFDVNTSPFVRDSVNTGDLVTLVSCGASTLVTPPHRQTLVRLAFQNNLISGQSEPVRFVVPRKNDDNRFSTSLQMGIDHDARKVPEYVNIRHRVRKRGSRFVIDDLKKLGSTVWQDCGSRRVRSRTFHR
jgi:hypothetical protein